mmetsp:Transcript_43813/g.78298  ORF Transcript_43813/g.78298 Transcript_43813/m.78298 type:complete len:384 (-) Transcript_43813:112-1263(-)
MSSGVSEMAQAVLQGYDTHLSTKWHEEERSWREEERHWRKEDLIFRRKEFEAMEAERNFMKTQREWHSYDVRQRALDNGRVLWQRFVEKNRRAVEERSEQLKSISDLSALIAGFSVIGFLEFQFDPLEHDQFVVGFFGFFTALTVVLMVNAFVSCSLVHASILKSGKKYVSEAQEADFIWKCHQYEAHYDPDRSPPLPARTFEQHWQQRCEGEWRRSFLLFTAGVPSFLLQLILASWIKFYTARYTAIVMTVVILAGIPYWALVQKRWSDHLLSQDAGALQLQVSRFPPMGLPFDYHRVPANPPNPSARASSEKGSAVMVNDGGGGSPPDSPSTTLPGDLSYPPSVGRRSNSSFGTPASERGDGGDGDSLMGASCHARPHPRA